MLKLVIFFEVFCPYLLLAEFSVRTVPIYGPSTKRAGHKSVEKNEDP